MSEVLILLLLFHLYLLVIALCEIEFATLRNMRIPVPMVAALLLLPEAALLIGGIVGVLKERRAACVRAMAKPLEFPVSIGERRCGWKCADCGEGGSFVLKFGELGKDPAVDHAVRTGHRVHVSEVGEKTYQRKDAHEA